MTKKTQKKRKIKKVELKNLNFKSLIDTIKQKIINHKKDLTPRKIISIIAILFILIITISIFMKFTLLITVDGSSYYQYLKYFEGKASFGEWPTVRGFSFPFIIFLITKIFGNSIRGILIGFLLFFLGMAFFAYKILKILIKENDLEYRQIIYWVLFVFFFLFNPLIIGYSHTLLTEAVTPFFYILAAYLCLKWNEIEFKDNKKKFIIYSIILILIGVFVWFIKQPYAPAYWGLLLISSVMSGIYHRKLKFFLQKIPVFFFCLVCTVLSIIAWNQFLTLNGKSEIEFDNSQMMANASIGFVYHYRELKKQDFCNINVIQNKKMDEKSKNKILELEKSNENWCDYLVLYDIYDLNLNYIETDGIIKKNENKSFQEVIGFYLKSIIKHPILVMHSYYENYLVLLNLERAKEYNLSGVIEADVKGENHGTGYIVLKEGYKNCWWQWQDWNSISENMQQLVTGMNQFESNTNTGSKVSIIMQILEKGSDLTFTIFLYLSLPVCIYGFIMSIIKKRDKSYFMITVLSGSAFIGIFFHVFTVALLDRYCYPVYPLMLLCMIIMCMDKSKKYVLKDNNSK